MERKLKSSLKLPGFPPVDSRRSSILILSLWSVCLLVTFAIILGYGVRGKLALVNRLDENDRLYFIAEAGIKKAILQIRQQPQKNYDALSDTWSNNSLEFKEIDIGDGEFSVSYERINERTGLTESMYGLVDEESKINVNKAGQEILERLFRIICDFDEIEAQELAASIIDWRDGDGSLSIPLGSAEDSYYRNLEYPYEAKDTDFEVLEEILLVKGADTRIFGKIKNYITIYGSGKININTASKAVLLAVGIGENTAGKILSFRAGDDGFIGTSDDNVFDAASNITPELSRAFHLGDAEIAQLSAIVSQYLVTDSNNFMARCISMLNGKKKTAEVICVINRSGKILYWRES